IAKKLGIAVTGKTPIEKTFILYFEEPGIYLNWVRIREAHADGERMKRIVREAALQIKGISGAFTHSELLTMNRDVSDIESASRQSSRADRSGDVLVTLKPGYIWTWGDDRGTTHGQPVEADQHVPLMLWGSGITPGSYDDEAAPTDLAKSLGKILN